MFSDWSELHYAAFTKDVEKVRLLVKSKPWLVLAQDLSKWTPVHLACCGISGWAFERSWTSQYKQFSGAVLRRVLTVPRRGDNSFMDRDKIQQASHEILSLFIEQGANTSGVGGSLSPSHIAASTDMPIAARMLAMFGNPVGPHKGGSPYQWAKQQENDLKDEVYSFDKEAKVYKFYRELLSEDGLSLLEQFNHMLRSEEWKDSQGESKMISLVFRLERMIAIRLTKYTRSLKIDSDSIPGSSTVHLCENCCSLGEDVILRIFFPSSTKAIFDSNHVLMDCGFCTILETLLSNYVPGSVKNLQDTEAKKSKKPKTDGFGAFDDIMNNSGTIKASLQFFGVLVRLDIFPNAEFNLSETLPEEPEILAVDRTGSITGNIKFQPLEFNSAQGKTWLSNCYADHPNCSKSTLFSGSEDNDLLPSRLIDVTRLSEKLVRVCENLDEPVPFTALSHRWLNGEMPEWVTKKNNLPQRLTWFSSDAFAKSIKDAFQVTVDLGIKYIWIDSICIVQDDRLDWKREASQMASIYTNSKVTIFADSALDDSKGFLGQRKLCSPYHPVALKAIRKGDTREISTIVRYAYEAPYKLSKQEQSEVEVKLESNMYQDHKSLSFRQDIIQSHLSNRGWILQERLLARRSLHFGQSQIYWECPSLIASEYGDTIEDEWLQKWIHNAREVLIGSDKSEKVARASWKNIVSTYTRMKLTRSSDRLPAISGIAKVFSTYLTDNYYFGTWSKTLHEDLMWQVDDQLSVAFGRETSSTSRLDQYPSWSWASVNSPVLFDLKTPRVIEGGCDPNCSAKCFRLSLPLESTTTALSESKIQVMEFPSQYSGNDDGHQASITISATMQEFNMFGPINSTLGYLEPGFTPLYDDFMAPIGIAFFDEPKRHCHRNRVLCLQLATRTVNQMSKKQIVDFMLLVDNSANNTYERIGIAHTNIRQTSRYHSGSIFEKQERHTVKLI
jgi:hypothetical protein